MFQKKILNDQDLDEAVKLRKRQQFEDERKKRIFNAKQRLFGVDSVALERQIIENQHKRSQQKLLDRRYEDEMANQSRLLHFQDMEQEKQRRILNSDLNLYRCSMQPKELRREFDLNDPDALKKAKPPRVQDYDMGLGLSSAQIFNGEDIGHHERRCRQYQQQRAWLDQQLNEKKQAEKDKRQAENNWQNALNDRDRCLQDMAISENRIRAQVHNSINEYNKEMAANKRFEREQNKKENMEDDLAEIYNMLTSDMLTENPNVGQSCTHPGRRVGYLYRGMTPEEKTQFYREQSENRKEQELRLKQNKMKENNWKQYVQNIDHEVKLKECELKQREKIIRNDLTEYNKMLALKKKYDQQEQNNKIISRNVISDEFYQQFNKSTR